ncbi:MAG: putative 29 kDa antigen CFP29 [Candidatus Tectimicrobiota bacterium]|nr:MAG: putative 29 kDa antigen CFP29 [Candidatus Tectomicrobia bacterium]
MRARDLLTGRRFLDLDGPYGVGLTALEVGNDEYCRQPGPQEAGAVMGRTISVPMLRKDFRLSIRRLAAHLEMGQPLLLTPVEEAAEAVARREEEFIYYGQPDFGLQGLLTAQGRLHHEGGDWSDLDRVLDDVLAAVNALDARGFRGPYALALAPSLYNGLFRRYAGTDMLQLEHLRRLCQRGVYKAPIEGGVLVDPRVGRLVVGQDLMVGYVGQDGIHYQLYVCESIVLMLETPQAICTIRPRTAS